MYRARLPIFALAAFAWGCLPTLSDECASDDDCRADQICAGGVCSPLDVDAGTDRGPDASPVDAAPDVMPDGLPDAGPVVDVGPVPDEGPAPDLGCPPQPGACNQLDDDCDGVIDEQSEAAEGCPPVDGALAACAVDGCSYACAPGAIPVAEDPTGGCRIPRGCALDGQWVRIAEGFEKSADAAQQVAITGRGAERFVAAYDLLAEGAEPYVRSFVFVTDQPDRATPVRLGAAADDLGDPPVGLVAAAVGERYVAAAWLPDGDANDRVQLMSRTGEDTDIRDVLVDWPQPPALVVDAGALVTVVESHIDRADPPRGLLVVDHWARNDGRDEVFPPVLAAPERAVGPQQNAAFTLVDGRIAMVGDVVGVDEAGEPTYRLRLDRFTPLRNLDHSAEVDLPGPVEGRVSVAKGAAGTVAFAAIAGAETLQWWTVQPGAQGFDGAPIALPWVGEPDAPQALSLPGGPGVVYRNGQRIQVVLPDPDFEDFAFEGELEGIDDKVRAIAAWQPAPVEAPGVVEVIALREAGGQGVLLFGRHVCR